MTEEEYRALKKKKIKTILSDLNKPRKAASFTHFNYVVLEKNPKTTTSLLGNTLFSILFKLFCPVSILDTFVIWRNEFKSKHNQPL